MKKILTLIKTVLVMIFTKRKIEPNTWIFSSSFNTKFNYNSKYLFEYVYRYHSEIKPIFVINDKKLRENLENQFGKGSFIDTTTFTGIKKALNGGVWFTSAGLPVYGLNLSKARIIINLWHGVPLKQIGVKSNNFNKINKFYFTNIFSKNYSYIFTTSKNLIGTMSESFNVSEDKIQVLGQPRNDALFQLNNKKEVLTSLYGDLPKYNKIILYAPTYRDGVKTKFFPFEDMNFDDLEDYLSKNELIIFIRCHQSETNLFKSSDNKRILLINNDIVEDIMDVLNIFDLVITDYSSIYIDYLLLKKPLMFLPYDKEHYLKERGLNFEYDKITPGPKPTTFLEFKNEISKLLTDETFYLQERIETNDFFNQIQTPCSKNIVKLTMKKIRNKK